MLVAQGHAVEHIDPALNVTAAEDLIVDIVDAQGRHIQRDPEPICQGPVGAFVLSTFVIGNQSEARRRLGFDAIPCHGNDPMVEGGTQVVHGIARQTLRHCRDDDVLMTFAEHAGFCDGLAVLQCRAQINATQ